MEWYYAKNGKQEGPVALTVLQEKLSSGDIAPTDLVWKESMANWTAAGDVAELAEEPRPSVESGPAPSPPPVAAPSSAASPQTVSPALPSPAPVATSGVPAPQGAIAPNMAVPAPTSGLAIASMVCGIVGIMLCYLNGLLALPAVICGHLALKSIAKSVTPIGGRGMAIAGLVTGYIGLLLQVMFIAIIGFAIASEM